MPCFSPIAAFQRSTDKQIYFALPPEARLPSVYNQFKPISLPCGKCIGCRLEHSRKWAVRCVLEASCHAQNCFVTLTYADEHLPPDGSLCKRDLTLFLKRLRKSRPGQKIRYFACGEYGERLRRPHYHLILFNYLPDDMTFKPEKLLSDDSFHNNWMRPYSALELPKARNEAHLRDATAKTFAAEPLATDAVGVTYSPELMNIWGKGLVAVGRVTFESAAYVARYCLKKINGDKAEEHYHGRQPEYVVMSRRPGIAADWFNEFRNDVYPADCVFSRGHRCKPPRYFDNLLQMTDAQLFESVKEVRQRLAAEKSEEMTVERLDVLREIVESNMKKVSRRFEKS